MNTVKLKFTDTYSGFVPNKNFLYNFISQFYRVELSETPDYLIYFPFGSEHLNYNNCVKIFCTGENQIPDFNLCDYALAFAYLQYDDRYLRLPNYYMYEGAFEGMVKKNEFSDSDLAKKNEFCSFVYSNNHASPERRIFFNKLSAYKKIASGGRFMNNIGGAVKDKIEFQEQSKFCIAFENASTPGYTTEKLIHAFASHTIPIYWGDPSVGQHFNTGSFINCHDFNSFDDVVEQIKFLDNNDAEYLKMLRTPALKNPRDREEKLKELRAFFDNIFEQPLDKAQRYSREYWNRKYLKNQILLHRAYSNSPRGLVERFYMYIFRKIERKNKNVLLWKMHRFLMQWTGKS